MNLKTQYLGLELESPFVVGASPLGDDLDTARRLEDNGAAAIVLHSLFEEQLTGEASAMTAFTETFEESHAEAMSYFPESAEYSLGPEDYLKHIALLKSRLSIPVIGSLNGRTPGGWVGHAKFMEEAGADAIELNIYEVPTDEAESGPEIEARVLDVVAGVREKVAIPFAVKLSPFYSSLPHLARNIQLAGANGLVLFNRFYQPDLDIEDLNVEPKIFLSTSSELLLRLRWMAILHGKTPLSLSLSGGVHKVHDAIKGIMAGADTLQMVSLLLRQGPQALTALIKDFAAWMVEHDYQDISEMRGCLSHRNSPDSSAFERANYLRVLQLWKV
ncbi:MAG: dihydroorotate dehydrogenase-like protein [Chthoniobacterales bacterium]|nr:dihydroorotate dehydrogenase-like protein [Chthoniobacterales bacterium]